MQRYLQKKDILKKNAEYYLQSIEVVKKKSGYWYKNFSEEEKDRIKDYQRKRYHHLLWYKKEALQNKGILFLLNIRMSEKTLKFGNIRTNKK